MKLDFFKRNASRIIQVAQIAALLWIGFELHTIAGTVYSGPSKYDDAVSAIADISGKLDQLTKAITLK